MNYNKTAKIGIVLFFIGLLATPAAIDKLEQWQQEETNKEGQEEALRRYGFFMQEASAEMGINFSHQAPELDSRLDHIMPQVGSVGASVSVTDFNNDGHHDLYLTNSAEGKNNALYKNNGDGTFTDVAEQMGVGALNNQPKQFGTSMGSIWGDYDNDGYEDLFVFKWGRPELFHNDEGKGFTRVTETANLPQWVNANTAVWFDYDRDGKLDLFIGGYYDEEINLWDLETTKIMPESFEYAQNGGRKYLYHNLGNGKFEEVSEELGLVSNRWSFSAAAMDLDDSGYPDLVVANDYGVDELYINREGKRFEEMGNQAGMGFSPKSGMNVSFGDIMNQGKYAIYVTNISEPGVLIQGNNLWMPVTSSSEQELKFQNMAGNLGVELGGWSYGAQFGDLNNDGFLDLYVANGYVSADPGSDYWYDFSKVAGGHKNIISDAANWPAMEGRSLSGFQENRIWLNDGAGKFQEVANAVGGSLKLDSRAVAFADLNRDGSLDILVSTLGGPVQVYKTQVKEGRSWIEFDLKGTVSNSSAIGAEVELFWDGRSQVQTVAGASGFSAQNQRSLHFGLGSNPDVSKAEIRWPSGITQTIESLELNTQHTITEPEK
ncbi:CRTAC1 family protein [Aliifodinibius sp. S!AR15-10]|uniref:CRTAC1 family protein n=1 Tax=Aliifodinibius sp. S!AR15-10 TaxID=2950437 RepID=UPI00286339F4|nr:CRTAC1 family protein [Aliifodinibius sp. S!AR15-10]MDR8391855.1 CRTAC1 family protein [Aliifodinibius sp. S!AR15-10]